MKITSETYYPEDASALKDIGRYTTATVEYSSLVLSSVFERSGRSISSGNEAVCRPCKKAMKSLQSVVNPLRRLGKEIGKLASPVTRTAQKIPDVGDLGVPVHLNKKAYDTLLRIEQRLANIEKKGLSVSGPDLHPTADDFKEKPSKEKSMLLRAILEDSKDTLDG